MHLTVSMSSNYFMQAHRRDTVAQFVDTAHKLVKLLLTVALSL